MALGIAMEELKNLKPREFMALVQETIDQMGITGDEIYLKEMMSRLLEAYEAMDALRGATSIKTIATILEDVSHV